MLGVIKIPILVIAALCAVIWIPLSPYRWNVETQTILLIAAFCFNWILVPRRFWRFVASIVLFCALFLVLLGAFSALGLGAEGDYWKPVHFASSVLVARLCIGLISFNDLIGAPLPERIRRDLLLLRSLLEHGGASADRIGWYCARFDGRRRRFAWGLATVLGIYVWLQAEAVEIAAVVDNKLRWLDREV